MKAAILALVLVLGCRQNQDGQLQPSHTALMEIVSKLRSEVDNLKGHINELSEQNGDLKEEVDQLRGDARQWAWLACSRSSGGVWLWLYEKGAPRQLFADNEFNTNWDPCEELGGTNVRRSASPTRRAQ